MIIDFIVDTCLYIFFDIFVEGFEVLSSSFSPKKVLTHRASRICTYIAAIMTLILLVMLISGITLLVESGGESISGWIMVGFNGAYAIFCVITKIISVSRRKNSKASDDAADNDGTSV